MRLLSMQFAVGCAAVIACSGCVANGPDQPHSGLRSLWRDFETLPAHRALSIAGDPDRVWVGAAIGDARTQASADAAALAECGKRRIVARIQDPCRLYARGGEIVWDPYGLRSAESETHTPR